MSGRGKAIMFNLLLEYQVWFKALHVIAVIFWMAGMMYLPRLFVYHHMSEVGGEMETALKGQEKRLLKIIINPALIVAFLFGMFLVVIRHGELDHISWLWVKLAAVFVMLGIHGILAKDFKKFAVGERPRSEKYYRKLNEVPAILIIIIVIMAVVEPF